MRFRLSPESSAMIIMPTMGRPHNLKRFIDVYRKTMAMTPVVVIFDQGDKALPEYFKLDYPANFTKVDVARGTRVSDLQNIAFYHFHNEPFYGFIGDDCVPETDHWDKILAEACGSNKISWGDDGIQGEKLATHPFIGGDLVRKIGWIAAPGFVRFFTDTIITDIARGLEAAVYLPDVKTTHYHPFNGTAPMDDVYRSAPPLDIDTMTYINFRKHQLPALIERLR